MLTFDHDQWRLLDGDVAIDVPRRAVPCRLRVWRVPPEYRADGYFVALQAPGEPEELPACDLSACVLVMDQELEAHPQTALDALKAAKKRQIEAERDAACVQPVHALGRTWDADKRSQELLASAITIAQAGGALPPVWRDANNDNMTVTSITDLLSIASAIAAQVQTAYAQSWARKAAVDAAQTAEDVAAA